MNRQQEMWYRYNLARRQALLAAAARMRYQAAGGPSGSATKAPAPTPSPAEDEGITVPPIPAPEETTYYFSDGTVSSVTELDEWVSSGASEDEIEARINDIAKLAVGADMVEGLGYSLRLDDGTYPNLSSVVIPDGMLSVGLQNLNVRELTIPNTVTDMFVDCGSLKVLNIGSGVSRLYDDEYGRHIMLPEDHKLDIRISKDNKTYRTQNGFILTKDGSEAVMYFGNAESATIPDGVTSVGDSAFYGCKGLSSVTVPDSVTSIGENAFFGCGGLACLAVSGKTMEYVKGMRDFRWGLDDGVVIRCSDGEIAAGETT